MLFSFMVFEKQKLSYFVTLEGALSYVSMTVTVLSGCHGSWLTPAPSVYRSTIGLWVWSNRTGEKKENMKNTLLT